MTELEAVNKILGMARIRAVSDYATNSDAAEAKRIIDEKDLEIQSKGWDFNTEVDHDLAADGNSELTLPDYVITADTYGASNYLNYVQVGRRMYDKDNNTFTFTSSTTVKMLYIIRRTWGCIPNPIQDLIAAEAAFAFCQYRHRDRLSSDHFEYIRRARADAWRHNSGTRNTNVFNTASAHRLMGERYDPYRGSRVV